MNQINGQSTEETTDTNGADGLIEQTEEADDSNIQIALPTSKIECPSEK